MLNVNKMSIIDFSINAVSIKKMFAEFVGKSHFQSNKFTDLWDNSFSTSAQIIR